MEARLNFEIISSGSRGNSALIWDNHDLIMIDCGITMRKFLERAPVRVMPDLSRSLLISHEHWDHSSGLTTFTGKGRFDIYSRDGTLSALGTEGYRMGDELAIGNFLIKAIPVPHDASDPVGFVIRWKHRKITVVSDLGNVPDQLLTEAKNSDILAFESNHDVEMLKLGPYPEHLKRRILSGVGHLSNDQAAAAISKVVAPFTRIVLTHLSQENNTPDLAMGTVTSYLNNRSIGYSSVECASQTHGSQRYVMA
ncbi:MAG TPA: MBL fold metallo-hydrolase [Thermoplasmataceae archaeon]|nr:MBL fold metallo-hydrolase [Thermoplasmatales archaeon AK]HLH85723.1 MBL fold metallo-hydrolase [Thermoplasmataceae archaeon]